jgi:hypothetical protein
MDAHITQFTQTYLDRIINVTYINDATSTSIGDQGRLSNMQVLVSRVNHHESCYRSVCSLGQVAEGKGQTGVTGASPPTVTSMGGSFYLGWLSPRETSLAIWGFERKRVKGLRLVFPFTDYRPEDSQMKKNHREGTCLRDKATMKLIHANSG